MNRALAALLIGTLAAAAARADIPVPPPPGKKFVPVENRVTADRAYPDLEFYVLSGRGPAAKVALAPDAPVKVPGDRRFIPGGQTILAAVPKGAAEKFPDLTAFAAAVRDGKVPGQAVTKHVFSAQTAVAANDRRTVVVENYRVLRIDPKGELVLALEKAADAPPGDKNAPEDGAVPADEEAAAAYPPRGGAVVAGLAMAVAAAAAGVWLRRRGRPA